MRKSIVNFCTLLSLLLLGVPSLALAQYYYPYSGLPVNYAYHNFSPTTYINTSPYVSVNAPQYTYPSSNSYSYPYSYQNYDYAYPSYSYSYPTYYEYWYPYETYQHYEYYPTYTHSYEYWWEDPYDYCYSGYGCYPMPVDDPHQWLYDPWSMSWY